MSASGLKGLFEHQPVSESARWETVAQTNDELLDRRLEAIQNLTAGSSMPVLRALALRNSGQIREAARAQLLRYGGNGPIQPRR